jgi:hypothetical protein
MTIIIAVVALVALTWFFGYSKGRMDWHYHHMTPEQRRRADEELRREMCIW